MKIFSDDKIKIELTKLIALLTQAKTYVNSYKKNN